jgi:hypothetical protein
MGIFAQSLLAFVALLSSGAPVQASENDLGPCRNAPAGLARLTQKPALEIPNPHLATNEFQTGRGLVQAHKLLTALDGSGLKRILENLRRGSVWLDMGAGENRLLNEGLDAYPNVKQGIGISYQRPANTIDARSDGRLSYLDGDYVENMFQAGKLDHLKGKVALITDVVGPLSYSPQLPGLLQIYLDLLQRNGKLTFALATARRNNARSGYPHRTTLNHVLGAGAEGEGMIEWLRTIPGVEVNLVKRAEAGGGDVAEDYLAIEITKKARKVRVPQNLQAVQYSGESPAARIFSLTKRQKRRPLSKLEPGLVSIEEALALAQKASPKNPVKLTVHGATAGWDNFGKLENSLISIFSPSPVWNNPYDPDTGISELNLPYWDFVFTDPEDVKKLEQFLRENENAIDRIEWKRE